MTSFKIDLHSLSAQTILSFVGLVLLTAIAAGLPAIWLLRNQLEDQAWAQVQQGGQAAQALYRAQQSEMVNLATLTAQRPTLQELLEQEQAASLSSYLEVLRTGADLDLILVCGAERGMVSGAGETVPEIICTFEALQGFQVVSTTNRPQVWLLATQAVGDEDGTNQDVVVVGQHLNDRFAQKMQAQIGLEHSLLVNHQIVATSLENRDQAQALAYETGLEKSQRESLVIAGQPYYLLRFPLEVGEGEILEAEVALAVTNISTTQQRLVWTLVGTLLLTVILGSSLGILLARRIGRPLARLTEAAATFSRGDLTRPVIVDTRLREVALVGAALEAARIDLNLTLGDLQREKAWTDHLLAAIVEGIVTLDRKGRIIFFSRGAERISGWRQDEVLGQTCDEIFSVIERQEKFSELLFPPGRRNKIMVELRDGSQAVLAVTTAQLVAAEGSEARLVLVLRDVSETEVVHRLMGHFLANIAHEFRTPLSALAASVELLLDQTPDLTTAEMQELVSSLHLGILGLQTLVDNLLEGASIEAGRFRVYARPVPAEKIISEGVRMMQPLLEKYGQHLVLELPDELPVVRADLRRTVQVLVNLLSNASKYGPEGAEINLKAGVEEAQVRISVADRGPGIPPEYRNDLFRRFMPPVAGSDKTQYGVGLGLSVVKTIVETQGGQVGVEDRPGGGAIFWFTLVVEKE